MNESEIRSVAERLRFAREDQLEAARQDRLAQLLPKPRPGEDDWFDSGYDTGGGWARSTATERQLLQIFTCVKNGVSVEGAFPDLWAELESLCGGAYPSSCRRGFLTACAEVWFEVAPLLGVDEDGVAGRDTRA